MRTKDHKLLGTFLLRQEGHALPFLYKAAFLAGNVEPDHNLFTYLHGMFRAKKFHGHNYENIYPVMKKIHTALQAQDSFGIRKYYRLGKLMHYTADAFTYPHNRAFRGSLRQHRRYEHHLHMKFSLFLQVQEEASRHAPQIEGFRELESLHQEYLQNVGSCLWDCQYILRVTSMLAAVELRRLSEPLRHQKGRRSMIRLILSYF